MKTVNAKGLAMLHFEETQPARSLVRARLIDSLPINEDQKIVVRMIHMLLTAAVYVAVKPAFFAQVCDLPLEVVENSVRDLVALKILKFAKPWEPDVDVWVLGSRLRASRADVDALYADIDRMNDEFVSLVTSLPDPLLAFDFHKATIECTGVISHHGQLMGQVDGESFIVGEWVTAQ